MGMGDVSVDEVWETFKGQILIAWSKTTRRMRAAGAFIVFAYVATFLNEPHLTFRRPAMLIHHQASVFRFHPTISAVKRPTAPDTDSTFQPWR